MDSHWGRKVVKQCVPGTMPGIAIHLLPRLRLEHHDSPTRTKVTFVTKLFA